MVCACVAKPVLYARFAVVALIGTLGQLPMAYLNRFNLLIFFLRFLSYAYARFLCNLLRTIDTLRGDTLINAVSNIAATTVETDSPEVTLDSPALRTTTSNDEKVRKLVQRMSARHMDLIRELSAKNREKEEQLRKEEQRQRKRESSLRKRILSRTVEDPEPADLPALPPDETSSAEERRLWKLKCNLDIERRQQEAIQRLQEYQRAKSVKREREQLKREWRAHKAKSYLLEQCQDTSLKEYLESKEKPRALPKLREASSFPARLGRRRDDPESEVEEAEASPCTNSAPSSPRRRAPDPPDAEEAQADATDGDEGTCQGSPSAKESPVKQRQVTSRTEYISRFVSRMRSAQIALKTARHLSDWKRLHCCPQSSSVFICAGGYPDFTKAMLARGWFQNEDKDSRFFDVKWAPASAINHENLLPSQVVNHFHGNREITTKVGLTLNLRNCLPMCGADPESFYPRAFDLYDPLERADFALNFKLTKAQAVLREFVRNIDSGAEMTFSHMVVSMSHKICLRLVTDPAEVMDCPEMAEALADVSPEEWAVLEQVCLDDCTQRLEGSVNADDLHDFINKRQVPTEAMREREKKEKARQKDKEKANPGPTEEKKRKKSKAKKSGPQEPLCAPVSSYQGLRAEFLIKQVREVLQEMDATSRQFAINGCRNAWIVKPSGKSRGRGIKVMRELDEIFRHCESDGFQWICQKYIERPQLIHGYKFDIRQWVLVTDWNPLTVYIWKQPYLRFAGQKYDETLSDRSEYVHLVNNSIIKKMEGFEVKNEDLNAQGYMWFRQQYEEWLHSRFCTCEKHRTPFLTPAPYTCETFGVRWEDVKFTAKEEDSDEEVESTPVSAESAERYFTKDSNESTSAGSEEEEVKVPQRQQVGESFPCCADLSGCHGQQVSDDDESVGVCENLWDTCIRKQMEDIIIWSLMCVVDSVQHRKGSVELFGYDFMIGEGLNDRPEAWLIEVNSSPACDYSTPVTCPLVKQMMEDTAKVMVDLKQDPSAATGEWQLVQHVFGKPVPGRMGFSCNSQLEVLGKKVKVPKKKKRKASKKPLAKESADGLGEEPEEEDEEAESSA
ncbi:unnamed protein product [Effrenium voratum]|nr:unnamed protein product [Effrenium voratum]